MATVVVHREVITGNAEYFGELNNEGKKHGKGILKWDDGDVFEGIFDNDEKKEGTFRWKAGHTYTGTWKNSLMHGLGKYTYADERTYEGEWVAGYKEGNGLFSYPSGDTYKGEFFQDLFEGYGIFK